MTRWGGPAGTHATYIGEARNILRPPLRPDWNRPLPREPLIGASASQCAGSGRAAVPPLGRYQIEKELRVRPGRVGPGALKQQSLEVRLESTPNLSRHQVDQWSGSSEQVE